MNKPLISSRAGAPFCVLPHLHRARPNDWCGPTNLCERFRQIRSEMAAPANKHKGASK